MNETRKREVREQVGGDERKSVPPPKPKHIIPRIPLLHRQLIRFDEEPIRVERLRVRIYLRVAQHFPISRVEKDVSARLEDQGKGMSNGERSDGDRKGVGNMDVSGSVKIWW